MDQDMIVYETVNPRQTFNLAKEMSMIAIPGELYILEGDVGVGKTVFANGFGHGLGIKKNLISPTFTIINEYSEGRIPLFHFDMYRIENYIELIDIGWYDYINRNGIILVEWFFKGIYEDQQHYKLIKIDKNLKYGDDYRVIRVINK